jgi:hypothetical protein
MESSPNSAPTPDLFYYGKKFSDLIDRLDLIRKNFIKQRDDQGLSKKELNTAIQNFETKRIEKILVEANRPDFPWQPQSIDDEDAEYYDSTADTFIDTDDKIILRAENTAYYQDAPSQVEVDRVYNLDPLGKIQISTESSSETDEDEIESMHYPILDEFDDEDEVLERAEYTQLDLNHAKSLTEMLELIVNELEKDYSDPNWYILPHGFSNPDAREKYYVIEKAQKDDQE